MGVQDGGAGAPPRRVRSRPARSGAGDKRPGGGLPTSLKRGMVRARRAGRGVRGRIPKIVALANISDITAAIQNRIRNPEAQARAMEGLSPEGARYATYNFRRGVMNGVMFTLVDALIAPSLVLALFVTRLGGSNVLVGLLPAILSGGWFLPQMLVAGRVQGMKLVLKWYRRGGFLRAVVVSLLVPATIFLADQPGLLLAVFFLLYSIYSLAGGVTGIPWLEVVGKVVSPRRRGTFFGLRNFWGGLLALAAAAPIGWILSEELLGLAFPYNFALLFGITALVVSAGVYFWSSIKEPPATHTVPAINVRTLLRRGIVAFRTNLDYRSFMVARILLALAAVADPFYMVFAESNLGAPPGAAGLYLAALSISSLLSNFIWSPLADRATNRTLMSLTVISAGIVPLGAVVISMFNGLVDGAVLVGAFTVVFVLSGLALGASRIVNNNMVLAIAPPAERATYIGFLNTVLGVVIFAPVFGGILVDLLSFEFVFLVSVALAALALVVALRMSSKRSEW